jgi:IS5 family transposase
MARSEFGRFYSDENEQREVARSLARAKAESATLHAPAGVSRAPARKQAVAKRKAELWREPRVRERRTELADARARLLSAARRKSTTDEP